MKAIFVLPVLLLLLAVCPRQAAGVPPRPAPVTGAAGGCDTVPPPDPYHGAFLHDISLNGGGNTLTISANDTFMLSLAYYIQECDTPGLFKQIVVGFAPLSPSKCVYESNVDCAGENGTISARLKAPNFPGTYALAFDIAADTIPAPCATTWPGGTPPASRWIACVTVLEGNIPLTQTGGVSGVSATGATLEGSVNPNGASTTVQFIQGTSPGLYPDTVTATQSPVSGVAYVPVSAPVTGLSPNTWYYYRVIADNVNGYNLGNERSYFTGPGFLPAEAVHDFGPVQLNSEKTDSISIVNPGFLNLTISSIIPLNGQFLVSPSGGTILPGDSMKFAVTFAPLAYGSVTSGIVFVHGGPTNPDTQVVTGQVPVGSVDGGWNIVSLPLQVANRTKGALFPEALGSAFGFASGYYPADTIDYGKGYWLKYPAAGNIVISGGIRINDTVAVARGWNLIGCPALPVPLDSIQSVPPGLVEGTIFRYNSGYQAVTSLEPAHGYWVKSSAAGVLYLHADLSGAAGAGAGNLFGGEEYRPIRISDAAGFTQELFTDAPGGLPVEIPPAPPSGVADIRFEGGYLALGRHGTAAAGAGIVARDVIYPLSVSWDPMPAGWELFVDGTALPMEGGGRVEVKSAGTLRLAFNGREDGPSTSPRSYSLSQNYPNPFNPSTRISFGIAEEGFVNLGVFNTLGERVATLVERELAAGNYSREFDATDLPAGVYFARLSAGRGVVAIKMLLVK